MSPQILRRSIPSPLPPRCGLCARRVMASPIRGRRPRLSASTSTAMRPAEGGLDAIIAVLGSQPSAAASAPAGRERPWPTDSEPSRSAKWTQSSIACHLFYDRRRVLSERMDACGAAPWLWAYAIKGVVASMSTVAVEVIVSFFIRPSSLDQSSSCAALPPPAHPQYQQSPRDGK